MNVVAAAADSGGAGQLATIAATFGVDWPHLLAQVASFSIVCLLLWLFAYHPVLRMLEERRKQIAQGIANAERIDAALAAIELQRRDVLAGARAEAAQIVEDAHVAGERVRAQEARRATLAAEQIVRKAHDAAAEEHARVLREARREVGRLVVMTTAAVAGKVLTADDQRRLADATARQLA